MLTADRIDALGNTLQRIFTFKISRSTFREVQNAIVAASEGDQEQAKSVFEALLTGKSALDNLDSESSAAFEDVVKRYSVPIALCRDIHEKGEFIGLVTSDTLRQGNLIAFLNRIRRIDGDEFQFITDVDQTLHLLLHWTGRLQELTQSEDGQRVLAERKQALDVISSNLDALTAGSPESK